MASAATSKPAGKGSLIITVAALTVIAVVAGGLVGKLIAGRLQPSSEAAATVAADASKPMPYPTTMDVRELNPIVTNLAQPADARVRIQVAMVYAKGSVENAALLGAQVKEDIVAFMKTLSIAQLQGASGLQALREDLDERAAVRSGGMVHEIIIETLVVQ